MVSKYQLIEQFSKKNYTKKYQLLIITLKTPVTIIFMSLNCSDTLACSIFIDSVYKTLLFK